jgi:hypothetical protein
MAKKWIQKAIKKPGALKKTLKSKGLLKGEAPVTETVLGKAAKSAGPVTKNRINLARTLRKLKK